MTAVASTTGLRADSKPKAIRLSRSKRRRVEAEFTGAEVTSNGGAVLLVEDDRRWDWQAAGFIGDERHIKSVVHANRDIIRQRTCGPILLRGPQ
ncbi:MAG: transposase [Gammaproteobacteria bacterium]|nr:transposase [Gammaproteobacteria bacterium]